MCSIAGHALCDWPYAPGFAGLGHRKSRRNLSKQTLAAGLWNYIPGLEPSFAVTVAVVATAAAVASVTAAVAVFGLGAGYVYDDRHTLESVPFRASMAL